MARTYSFPWEEIAKSGPERLCAPMSSIILQSFNLVGHIMREEIQKTELLTDGWTDGHPTYSIRSFRRGDLKIAKSRTKGLAYHPRIDGSQFQESNHGDHIGRSVAPPSNTNILLVKINTPSKNQPYFLSRFR